MPRSAKKAKEQRKIRLAARILRRRDKRGEGYLPSPKRKPSPSPAFPLEEAALPADIEKRLAQVDWRHRDVLIGTLRSGTQLKACKDHRFYYIPAGLIQEAEEPIRYVALFQTPRVFPGNAGIYCYGEVLHSTLVQRKDIWEVPQTRSAPDSLYYRYQVRDWLPLPTPVLPGESGFIRAFTNLFLLENAEVVPELLLPSEEAYRLYTELKRRTRSAPENRQDPVGGFTLGHLRVLLDDGHIHLFRNGQLLGTCRIAEFSKCPTAAFRGLWQDF